MAGRPHEIEIWFAIEGQTLYMLPGGRDRSNPTKPPPQPGGYGKVDDEHFKGRARGIESEAEDKLTRSLLVEKYDRVPGTLAHWRSTALPVAVDLVV